MTKGLDSDAACGARPATAGCLWASAGQGCGPHGSKEPKNDATTFVQKPLFRTLRRIPFSDCFTTPAAGYRFRETGALANTGTLGAAWSSSPSAAENTGASDLWCHAAGVKPLDSSGRAHGFPVRCVQHLQTAFILFALPSRTDRAPVVAGALLRRGLPPTVSKAVNGWHRRSPRDRACT